MWGLRGVKPNDFKLMDFVSPEDGPGEPCVDAYPSGDYNKQLVLGPGEQVYGAWPASKFRVSHTSLESWNAGGRNFSTLDPNLDKLLGRTKGTVVVTSHRVVAMVPGVSMSLGSMFTPSEWMALAMMKADREMKAAIVAGHIPLESVSNVEIRNRSIGVAVAMKTISRSAMLRFTAAIQPATASEMMPIIQSAVAARWNEYTLPDELRWCIATQNFEVLGDAQCLDAVFVRPLGGNVGLVSDRVRTHYPDFPTELRNVEPGRQAISEHADRSARAAALAKVSASNAAGNDGSNATWECPECGFAKNKAGRLRCTQCRRETGHLALD